MRVRGYMDVHVVARFWGGRLGGGIIFKPFCIIISLVRSKLIGTIDKGNRFCVYIV